MTRAQRLLIFGGMALALLGMGYGLWYAVFAEHQALDSIGSSLAGGFSAAAARNPVASHASLMEYKEAKYVYDRQVDVHGHWIGLGILLIMVGIAYGRVSFTENVKFLLALSLLFGAIAFPLGVLLQTFSHGDLPRAVAILGSGLIIASLAAITLGFARSQTV